MKFLETFIFTFVVMIIVSITMVCFHFWPLSMFIMLPICMGLFRWWTDI